MSTPRPPLPALIGAVLLALGGSVAAQDFPARPNAMVVPFPAGGPTDVIARVLAERMRVSLGQPVIVENAGGAAGSIGVGRVARAAADGHTLSFGTLGTHVVNAAMLSLAYDTLGDFEPLALVARSPMVMTASKAFPPENLKGGHRVAGR